MADLHELDDVQLMRRIGEGDAAAYRVMADRYLPRIAGFAQRLLASSAEADDVVQDTFLKLWTEAASLAPHGRPSTWLYRVAHNACIDRLRRRRSSDDAQLERQSAGDRPSTLLSRKQTAERVQLALAELPERQRAAMALVHYDGLSGAEAAAVMDIHADALESLLSRARRTLREKLADVRAQPEVIE